MPGPFAITAATNTVFLDDKRAATTSFTVSNLGGRQTRGRAQIVAQNPAAQPWITLVGEAERDFAIAGTQQYILQIAAPPNAPAGSYPFRLDMVAVDNPADSNEGPTTQFTVPMAATKSGGFPWWIILVAVIALLLVVAIAFFVVQNNQNNQHAAATATATTVAATNTAVAAQATNTVDAGQTATATALVAVGATQTALAIPSATPDVNGMLPIYDFVNSALNAAWQAGPPALDLPWGSGQEAAGTLLHQDSYQLDDDSMGDNIIIAAPNIPGGFVEGCYSQLSQQAYVSKADDVISGKISFVKDFNGGSGGDSTFKVIIRPSGLPQAELLSVPLKYGDGVKSFAARVGEQYANRRADFCLRFEANGAATPGQSVFFDALLNREPGQ